MDREDNLTQTLDPIVAHFAQTRHQNEDFGDFCHRIGLDGLLALGG